MIEKSIFKDGANKNLTHPKTQKGITLIALVITIIVLLVLAGVTISMVLGDDGIIQNAQKASALNKDAAIEEAISMIATDKVFTKYGYGESEYADEDAVIAELENRNVPYADELEKKGYRQIGYIGKDEPIFSVESILPYEATPNEYFVFSEDGKTIKNYTGTDLTEIIIPKGITTIADWAFSYHDEEGNDKENKEGFKKIESIVLADGVNSIGDWAFLRDV